MLESGIADNQLFTMHGTIMLLLYATPILFGFVNYIVPLQIGAPDVAFPRLNALSYWLFLFGGLIVLAGFLTAGGAPDFGWTAYIPLSGPIRQPGPGGDLCGSISLLGSPAAHDAFPPATGSRVPWAPRDRPSALHPDGRRASTFHTLGLDVPVTAVPCVKELRESRRDVLSGVRSSGMDAATRVLVLANRTADSSELLRQVLARHGRGPIAVTLLAPAIWEVQDPHGGTESAWRRLRAAQKRLQAGGVEVSCMIGDPDPMTAFEREWKHGGYDEVIVATLPSHLSKWLRTDLPRRIRLAAAGVPVTHVIASPGSAGAD